MTSMTAEAQSSISELSIVDTCTRLVFGDGPLLSETDELIVAALERDDQLTGAQSLGDQIREMGVNEMIALVGRTKRFLDDEV